MSNDKWTWSVHSHRSPPLGVNILDRPTVDKCPLPLLQNAVASISAAAVALLTIDDRSMTLCSGQTKTSSSLPGTDELKRVSIDK